MENQEQVEDSLEQTLEAPKSNMYALFVPANTMGVLVLDVAQKCNELIFKKFIMTLDDLKQKVIYQNTLDVWVGACEEKHIKWDDTKSYRKFIDYLLNQNLNMKKFPLCVSSSDSQLESERQKAKFAEILSETKEPNCETYTVRLNDSTIDLIRKFDLKN
jgi:hypothetical protein